MSVREYTCIPIGEFTDLINAYQIMNGAEEEKEEFIPSLR